MQTHSTFGSRDADQSSLNKGSKPSLTPPNSEKEALSRDNNGIYQSIRKLLMTILDRLWPFYFILILTVIPVGLGSGLSSFTYRQSAYIGEYVIASCIAAIFVTTPLLVDICLDISFRRSLYLFDGKHNFKLEEKLIIFIGCILSPLQTIAVRGHSPTAAFRQVQCSLLSCAMLSFLRRKLLFLHNGGVITLWDMLNGQVKSKASNVYMAASVLLAIGRIAYAFGAMQRLASFISIICIGGGIVCYFIVFASAILRNAPKDTRIATVVYYRAHSEFLIIASWYALFLIGEFVITTRSSSKKYDPRFGLIASNSGSCLFCLGVFVYSVRMMKIDIVNEKIQLESHRSFARFISHELRTPLTTVCLGLDLLEMELAVNSEMSDKASLSGCITPIPLSNNFIGGAISSSIRPSSSMMADQGKRIVQLLSHSNAESPSASMIHSPRFSLENPSLVSESMLSSVSLIAHKLEDHKTSKAFAAMKTVKEREEDETRKLTQLATVKQIRGSCDDVVGILDSLIKYDTSTSGAVSVLSPYPTSENVKFIRSTVKPFYVQAKHADISLEFWDSVLPGNDFVGYIDKGKLAQVVRNLLSNAIRFTPAEGKVQAIVELQKEVNRKCLFRRENYYLVVTISDSGIGMTSERVREICYLLQNYQESNMGIFEQLQTHDNRASAKLGSAVSTTRTVSLANLHNPSGKPGLGLSISARIMDEHSGSLRVTSPGLNMGSSIIATLPLEARVEPFSYQTFSQKPTSHKIVPTGEDANESDKIGSIPTNLLADNDSDDIDNEAGFFKQPTDVGMKLASVKSENSSYMYNGITFDVINNASKYKSPLDSNAITIKGAMNFTKNSNPPSTPVTARALESANNKRTPNGLSSKSRKSDAGQLSTAFTLNSLGLTLAGLGVNNVATTASIDAEDGGHRFKPVCKRVLVVDDSKLARTMICSMVTKLGFVCDEACNGIEAVDFMKRYNYTKTVSLEVDNAINCSSGEQSAHDPVNNLRFAGRVAISGSDGHNEKSNCSHSNSQSNSNKAISNNAIGENESREGSNGCNAKSNNSMNADAEIGKDSVAGLISEGNASGAIASSDADGDASSAPKSRKSFVCCSASGRKFDVCMILIDNVMPRKDGPTAVREIRAMGYDGPIIGVTGNTLPSDVNLFLEAGVTIVAPKPLRVQQFKQMLQLLNIPV